jgi:hypothetical protein
MYTTPASLFAEKGSVPDVFGEDISRLVLGGDVYNVRSFGNLTNPS